MTKQELKKLRDIIYAVYEDGRMRVARIDVCHIACKSILALIREAGYVKLAEDQSLPINPNKEEREAKEQSLHQDIEADLPEVEYWQGQQDMLKAGWRKVEIPKGVK